MKHAGQAALKGIEPLLFKLRHCAQLIERTPGSFYLRSKAYLHFHEDVSGVFADVKLDHVNFERFRVTTKREQARLLSLVTGNLRKQG